MAELRITRLTRSFRSGLLLLLAAVTLLFVAHSALANPTGSAQTQLFYLSPVPGADFVPPGTTIAFRSEVTNDPDLLQAIRFVVTGSLSGVHEGRVLLAHDNKTLLFVPRLPFVDGEEVQVRISAAPGAQLAVDPLAFSFSVSAPKAAPDEIEGLMPDVAAVSQGDSNTRSEAGPYRTAPADLPRLRVTRGSGTPGEGYFFMSLYDRIEFRRRLGYMMIVDDNGEPVFYRSLAPYPVTMDFKKQPDGRLTYFLPAPGINTFYALDNQYEIAGQFKAGNGYTTDLHDLQVLPNGNGLLMIHDGQTVDLSGLVPGGRTDAYVIGCVIQEVDPAGNVIFQWRSWDHQDAISILDTLRPLDDDPLRYIHCNSVERDTDGNILVSNRNLSNIIKINRQTGAVMWQMGGKKNQFAIADDRPFLYQHDARRLANGHMTIYDNAFTGTPPYSRGIEYTVDESTLTATKVAQFQRDPAVWAVSMGNMQRLPNGNSVIGWGFSSEPVVTEFDAAGNMVMEISADPPLGSYRAFRFPWIGLPDTTPDLAIDVAGKDVTLYFSWNGSTETVRYVVFGGPEPNGMRVLGTAVRDGFETTYDYALEDPGVWYFRVVPYDAAGKAGPASSIVSTHNRTYLPLVN